MMNFVRKVPLTSELALGWGEGGRWRGHFATYGRSPKEPTVGRHHDLLWVASTTYSRFLLGPLEGRAEVVSWRRGFSRGKGASKGGGGRASFYTIKKGRNRGKLEGVETRGKSSLQRQRSDEGGGRKRIFAP